MSRVPRRSREADPPPTFPPQRGVGGDVTPAREPVAVARRGPSAPSPGVADVFVGSRGQSTGMAHRAVLARRREDGQYGCYRSRWGGTDSALAAVCAGTSPTDLPVAWVHERETGGFAGVVAGLDYLATEALYRADGRETTAFLPLWFGLPLPDPDPSPRSGALVEVTSLGDARLLRDSFRCVKGALADTLAAGTLPAAAAPVVLRGAIAGLDGRERYVAVSSGGWGESLYTGGRPDGP